MPLTSARAPLALPSSDELLALLDESQTALALICPRYAADNQALTNFSFEYLNPAAQRLLGLSDHPETAFLACFPHAAEAQVLAFLGGVLETGQPGYFECPGTPESLAAPLCIEASRQGKRLVVKLCCTGQLGQLPMEAALRASRAREQLAQADAQRQRASLERFMGQTQAIVCILRGPAHRLEYGNPAYQRLFSGRHLTPGFPVAVLHPEAVAQGIVARLDDVYASGKSSFGVAQPLTLTPPDGQPPVTRYFTFSYDAYLEDGRTAGVSIFAYDVTDQVHGRQQATRAAAELQLVMANVPVFLFRTDPAGRMTYVNEALFEWSGLAPGPTDLDRVWDTVHPDDAPALRAAFKASLATAQGWESPVYRIRRRDGEYRWSLTRTQPNFRADGHLVGYSGVNVEIHKQIEMQRQLTRVNADLDMFIYTASHDLKAPISNLEGLLHALLEELPAEVRQAPLVQPMLERMQRSVDRFKLTIAQLTDVSRLQQAQTQPAETMDLAALVEDIRLDLAPALADSGAKLTVDVEACPHMSFAPKNLRCIVYNLLSNAVKYRHPDRSPLVLLRCHSSAHTIVLEVQDNGLGLTISQQGKLFGMFRRLHDHVEGSGIGLYMVKRIVENAGGTIAVHSAPGVGSTFTVSLPAPASAS
ncbi:hypothetical protein AUC43_02970 [Hymenobacter sedentarius]|uniref:histidine kinase n=1 Tax=Hymenobacter sedentarius TaxID=1411621 RepID=A0A0U4BL77_9BACT|nr:ATP-binding protein [Hymenobacter sedentarius]ALW84151.1 hypothetical protein AUC43_02970 [Hymenobacter sedentarius]